MSILVRPWFILEVVDQHFSNQTNTVLQLKPFKGAHLRMKNYTIRGQFIKNRYDAYISSRSSESVWEELKMNTDLYFQLINTELGWSHRDDSKISQDNVCYFNTKLNVESSYVEEAMLKPSKIEIHPLNFTLEIPELLNTDVEIKNSKGKTIHVMRTEKEQSRITIDLSLFGTGMYEVWVNNKILKTFFGTTEQLHEHCYGIVHLNMETIIDILKTNTVPKFSLQNIEQHSEMRLQDQKIKALLSEKPKTIAHTISRKREDLSEKGRLTVV